MDKLTEARRRINETDRKMAELFIERMDASAEIAAYKKEHGLPIFDEAREKEVLNRNGAAFARDDLKGCYLSFLQGLMDLSKRWQTRQNEGMKIAYSGVEGAFADIASRRIFPDLAHIGFGNFDEAYNAVVRGECDCAVLPIENSYAGAVGRVMDLIFEGDLIVSGVYTLPICQNLLGLPGADRTKIKKVISHPQALGQCEHYLKSKGYELIPCENTAIAAKTVAERGDPTLAAVASAETAALYGLTVLDHDINESAFNSTRFAVLTRSAEKDPAFDKFILLFTVNDVAGALASAINVISAYGFNMKALKSRPVREKAWQYYFYVEAEGDETSPEGRRMLEELSKQCEKLKVAGHFGAEKILKGGEKQ